MASIQRKGFSPQINELSNIFKALGHPARLTIIELLLKEGRIKCKEIALSIPLAETTVNRHTRVLFDQGIIGYEKYINETHYILNPIAVSEAKKYLKMTLKNNDMDTNYSNVYFHKQPIA